MKLLLFDIDGTMLRTNGVGRRSITAVLERLANRPISTDPVSFSGKTDPQILREVLAANGVPDDEIEDLLPEALKAYVETATPFLTPENIVVLPGVPALIARLAAEDGVQLALLTGNLEATALTKVEAAGLSAYFGFGAYGSDDADRNALPAIAVDRAHDHTGTRYEGAAVVVVGDTEHDIRCSRTIGASCVAVCTGHFGRADLSAHAPDLLLDDLTDADGFVQYVTAAA